jgi:hypothetical protein
MFLHSPNLSFFSLKNTHTPNHITQKAAFQGDAKEVLQKYESIFKTYNFLRRCVSLHGNMML